MSPAEEPGCTQQTKQASTILLVEDEVLVRMAMAEVLREAGFTVVEASSGEEAQALVLAGLEPDLVFSDINTPGHVNGIALADWLRETGVTAPIVLTSARPDLLAEARQAPRADLCLSKPYSYEDIVASFRALLSD